MSIMLVLVSSLETRTKHGPHTGCVVNVCRRRGSGALKSQSCQHLVFQWFGGSRKDMAKNITFAHVLLMGTMLKISIKFNILTCLVPCDQFFMGQVSQFHSLPPRVLETVEDSVSEMSWSDSQKTESSEYECDDDQQPKLFN